MHGVDHDGHPGHTGRQPSVHAWFRIVGVHDVGSQPAEHADQLGQCLHVLPDRVGPRCMLHRLMPDTPRLQVTHVGAGGRSADHLHARVGEGAQLGTEEESQAHVGRRQVHQPAARPRYRDPLGVTASSPLPGHRNQLVVDGLDLAHGAGHVEERAPGQRARREPLPQLVVARQRGDGVGQGVGMLGRDHQGVRTVGPQVRDFAHRRDHQRHAHRGRLHQGRPGVPRGARAARRNRPRRAGEARRSARP